MRPEEYTTSAAGQLLPNPHLLIRPYLRRMGENYHNAQKGVLFWQKQGLLHEYTGQKHNRIFIARELLDLMSTPPSPLQAG